MEFVTNETNNDVFKFKTESYLEARLIILLIPTTIALLILPLSLFVRYFYHLDLTDLIMPWFGSSPAVQYVKHHPIQHFPLSSTTIPVAIQLHECLLVDGRHLPASLANGCDVTLTHHSTNSSDHIKVHALWATKSSYCANPVALVQLVHLVESFNNDAAGSLTSAASTALEDACYKCCSVSLDNDLINFSSTTATNFAAGSAAGKRIHLAPPDGLANLSELSASPHNRTVFPIVIACLLPPPYDAASTTFTKAFVAIIHLPDNVCTMRAQVLHQFLVQSNNQVRQLKPFFDSSVAASTEATTTVDVRNSEDAASLQSTPLISTSSSNDAGNSSSGSKLCIVCYDKPPCMLLPCRHVAMCSACFNAAAERARGAGVTTRTCCVCRAYVTGFAEIV